MAIRVTHPEALATIRLAVLGRIPGGSWAQKVSSDPSILTAGSRVDVTVSDHQIFLVSVTVIARRVHRETLLLACLLIHSSRPSAATVMVCKKCESASPIVHTRSIDGLTGSTETLQNCCSRPVHLFVQQYQGRLEESRGEQAPDTAGKFKE